MDELPSKGQWRAAWEAGVTIDGVWIPGEVLDGLSERPHNTEVTAQEPLTVFRDVQEVLEKHRLACSQTRGGIHAGPAFADWFAKLELPPRPDNDSAGFGPQLRELADQAAGNAGEGRAEPYLVNAAVKARAHVSSAFALGHLSKTMEPVAEAGVARRLGELLSSVRDLVNYSYQAGAGREAQVPASHYCESGECGTCGEGEDGK